MFTRACARIALAAMLVSLPASVAVAQPSPIAAVVEVRGVAVDPQAVRQAVAERLGRPVLSPLELGNLPTAGTLTVACENGRALVHYRDASGREETRSVGFTALAAAVAAIADAAAALARRTSEPFALPSEVIDPFVGDPATLPEVAIRVEGEEVLNPWQPLAPSARTHGLAPWPAPRPAAAPPRLAVPPGSVPSPPAERADSLSTPAPGAAPVD